MRQTRCVPATPGGGKPPAPTGGRLPGVREQFQREWLAVRGDLARWAGQHVGRCLLGDLAPEDLVQEVACRAWRRYATWDARRGDFRGWVLGIAHNVLREALRRHAQRTALLRRRALSPPAEPGPDLAATAAHDEGVERFVERVRRLRPADRELLLRCGIEQRPQAEVAARLETTPAAVSKRWQRLCRRLREEPRCAALREG